MDYTETLRQLFRSPRSVETARSLDLSHELDRALDYPARSYPIIHIAGTNGKGSVSLKIAKALELSGYRVGLYTSPHLYCFRERICINGVKISEEDVVSGLEKISIPHASFFERATFLAFDYFRKEKVDVAVIETGIGGKFDPTNVAPSILSVITSISREHAHILGDDLDQIAAEKAGILKEGIPVVLGPKARFQPIYDRAKLLNCPLHLSKKISHFFDEENSATARLALEHLPQFILDPEAITRALSQRPPCRFERRGEVIFDVAHNPDAVFYLLQALHTFYPHSKFRFVTGFSSDKEYEVCLELISAVATHIHLVEVASERAATLQELKAVMEKENPSSYTLHASIEEGVREAYAAALSAGELLVVCGSFYLMEAAGKSIHPPEMRRGSNEKTLSSLLSTAFT